MQCSGRTVGDCLRELTARYPGARPILFKEDGSLQKMLAVFVNGENAYPGELEREVHDGDTIYLMYTIVGG
jgi:molybdopterin converting factor small subunit